MGRPQIREGRLIEEGLEEIRENTAAEAAEEARYKMECERADEEERKNFGFYMDSLYPPEDDFYDDFDDSYDY